MDAPIARSDFRAARFGLIRRVEETGSTNADLVELAAQGAQEQVLVAAHQQAGRGRLGRTWVAPPGASLLGSFLTHPALAATDIHLVTMAMGCASAHAVGVVSGIAVGCKWPNDLVTLPDARSGDGGDVKVSGILAESVAVPAGTAAVIVGTGINVNWPDEMPPDLAASATSLRHLRGGEAVDIDALLTQLIASYEFFLGLAESAPARLVEHATTVSATVGRTIRVTTPGDEFQALATGLAPNGELEIERDGARQRVSVGDVVHVRPTS